MEQHHYHHHHHRRKFHNTNALATTASSSSSTSSGDNRTRIDHESSFSSSPSKSKSTGRNTTRMVKTMDKREYCFKLFFAFILGVLMCRYDLYSNLYYSETTATTSSSSDLLLFLPTTATTTTKSDEVDGSLIGTKRTATTKQLQIENYRNGNGMILNVHITHHGGTFLCEILKKNWDSNT